MHHLLIIAVSFLLGLSSGFIGGLSTGGGLISIPGLIFMGLSPGAAIATTRLSALTGGLSAFFRYRQERMVRWDKIWPFIIIAILGGIVGSKLLLQIDQHTLQKAVGILLLILAPALAFNQDFGLKELEKTKRQNRAGYLVIFLVMIYAAMFGGGGGTFMLYTLVYFFGMTIIQSTANGNVMGLFAIVTALIYYLHSGIVNFSYGIPLMIGSAIGGYMGAHAAIEKGNAFVRIAFLVIVFASGVKLLFF